MPDLETVIPVLEHMKRTLVPERDTYILARIFLQLGHYQNTGKVTGLHGLVLFEVSQFVV